MVINDEKRSEVQKRESLMRKSFNQVVNYDHDHGEDNTGHLCHRQRRHITALNNLNGP